MIGSLLFVDDFAVQGKANIEDIRLHCKSLSQSNTRE